MASHERRGRCRAPGSVSATRLDLAPAGASPGAGEEPIRRRPSRAAALFPNTVARRRSVAVSPPASRSRCSAARARSPRRGARAFPARRVKPGRYVYAIRMVASMNSSAWASSSARRSGSARSARSDRTWRLPSRPARRADRLLLARPLGREGLARRRAAGGCTAGGRDATAPRSRPERIRTRTSSSSGWRDPARRGNDEQLEYVSPIAQASSSSSTRS